MNAAGVSSRGRILVVVDDPENHEPVNEILESTGFEVALVREGLEDMHELERHPPDCIVLDVVAPRANVSAICRRLRKGGTSRTIPIVMLVEPSEVEDQVRALDEGADDVLTKPANFTELLARLGSLVRIRRLRDDLDTADQIIVSLVEALESSDPHARGHARRVTARCVEAARRLAIPERRHPVLALAALLHDIGKIGIPTAVLRAGPLRSHHEEAQYRRHPELGEGILAAFPSFAGVRRLIRHHHERLDGSGFPDGLSGEALGPESLILAAANRYDDLATDLDTSDAAATLRREGEAGLFPCSVVEAVLSSRFDDSGDDPVPPWVQIVPATLDPGPATILLAGNDNATWESIGRLLAAAGHEIVRARSGAEAASLVVSERPSLALIESRLLESAGLDVAVGLKHASRHGRLAVVVVAARDETGLIAESSDIDDLLFLPVNGFELRARVRSVLRLHTYLEDLEDRHDVILSLASALEERDPSTRGHSDRVGELAERLARQHGLDEADCRLLRTAGLLHDIGKIGLPDQLIHKRGALEPGEFEMVMRHPVLSERICAPMTTLQEVLPLIRHHHERFDGSGYPDHLAGDAIPLGARILGLADAFDALTSSRAYRATYDPSQALALLSRETALGRWDPHVLALLQKVVGLGDTTATRHEPLPPSNNSAGSEHQ